MANTGYCVKCKKVVLMADAKESEMTGRGGSRKVLKSVCQHCGKTVCRITGK